MNTPSLHSRFITLEGIDASGKSTFMKSVRDAFGDDVVLAHEPGGSELGKAIRNILLDRKDLLPCSEAEMLLFFADRQQNYHEVILPNLKKGKIVVCDRHFDSTFAYQAATDPHANLDLFWKLAHMLPLWPSFTLFFDLMPSEAMRRLGAQIEQIDRMESKGESFQKSVREGFLSLYKNKAKLAGRTIKILNAHQNPALLSNEALNLMREFLKKTGVAKKL